MAIRVEMKPKLVQLCVCSTAFILPTFAYAQLTPNTGPSGNAATPTVNYPPNGQSGAYPINYSAYSYSTPRSTRSNNEMSLLYATSIVYGVGLGVEISNELGIKDPGLFVIAPALLGAAAPIGAYALDKPTLRRGVPTAISVGLLLGAGEGLAIAGTQMVRANASDAWGFRGLSRATALGATVGGVGGWLAGTWLAPPPNTALVTISGAVWGTAIGSMFGYGASPGNYSFGRANDWAAIGGLIGYNLGVLGAASFGTIALLSDRQIAWMWAGAGIGAAASLPIFLFYAGDGGPPARRGFVFMGTATTLGVAAGAVLSAEKSIVAWRRIQPSVAAKEPAVNLMGVIPYWNNSQAGLIAVGTFR